MLAVGQIEKEIQQRVIRLLREDLGYRYLGDRFVALMDQHLPRWRHLRRLLNDAPLGHADWSY